LVHEAGQSLVEFALVTLFVILPVTFGIIDGSILFYKWVVVTNGAREGARAGAIYHYDGTGPSDRSWDSMHLIDLARQDVITHTVEAMLGPLVSMDDWYIDYPDSPCVIGQNPTTCGVCAVYDVHRGGVCRDGDYYAAGHSVTVAITHTHTSMVGLVIGLGQIDLTATATMRIEPGGPAPAPPPPP